MPVTDRYAAACSTATDWQAAPDEVGARLAAAGGGGLGFVYATDHFAEAFEAIVERLRSLTGVADWVGTVGFGIAGPAGLHYDRPALSAMLTGIAADDYRLFTTADPDPEALGETARRWAAGGHAPLAVVHGDPRNADVAHSFPLFAEQTGSFLVGTLTASRHGPHPQVAGRVVEGGLSGVLFAGTVAVTTGLTQGCQPIGPAHEVTAAEGGILVELDGRPALEVFREDIGEVLARDLRRTAGFIFAALPFGGGDLHDYLVRSVVGADEQRGLLAIGDVVEAGARVMFCRRDNRAAEQDLTRLVEALGKRTGGRARGALYHSCLARGPNMFAGERDELEIIADALPDVPIVGVFGNGEIAGSRLYTMTGVLTLFL